MLWILVALFEGALVGGVFGLVYGDFGEGRFPEVVYEARGFEPDVS